METHPRFELHYCDLETMDSRLDDVAAFARDTNPTSRDEWVRACKGLSRVLARYVGPLADKQETPLLRTQIAYDIVLGHLLRLLGPSEAVAA